MIRGWTDQGTFSFGAARRAFRERKVNRRTDRNQGYPD